MPNDDDEFKKLILQLGNVALMQLYNRLESTGSFEFSLQEINDPLSTVALRPVRPSVRIGILHKPTLKYKAVVIPKILEPDSYPEVSDALYKTMLEFEHLIFADRVVDMDAISILTSARFIDTFKASNTSTKIETQFESDVRAEIASRGDFVVDIPKLVDVLFKLGVMVPKEDIQNPNKFEYTEDKEPW